MKSISLFGVRIDNLNAAQARILFTNWIGDESLAIHTVCTPNSEFLLAAYQDSAFAEQLNNFDLNLPDGVGLRFASAALANETISSRVPGVLALEILAELCASHEQKLLLLGDNDSCNRARINLRQRFLGLEVTAFDPGKVNQNGDLSQFAMDVVSEIEPTVIAFGLGRGKQEACIRRHLMRWPSVRIMIGVGGACAMIGGTLPRAPELIQKLGLEWLWRLWIEPSRWRRIWRAVAVFPAVVISTTLREGRFWRASYKTIPEIFQQLTGR